MKNDSEVKKDLEAYIVQLDQLITQMNNSGFPFGDSALVYAEVRDHLKEICGA